MSFSVNKVTLLGRLGADPEFKQLTDTSALATFSLATDQSYKDDSGQWQTKTDWHRITAWGKAAEFCKNYIKKGSKIYMEGSIHNQVYEKDGEKKYVTNIRLKEIVLLDKIEKRENQNSGDQFDAPANTASSGSDDLPF